MNEIARAAALLRAGDLVAFPTETVYGLELSAMSVMETWESNGLCLENPASYYKRATSCYIVIASRKCSSCGVANSSLEGLLRKNRSQ